MAPKPPNWPKIGYETAFEYDPVTFSEHKFGANLSYGPNLGKNQNKTTFERDPVSITEHESGAYPFSRPKISTKFTRNQNGSSNSNQISTNTTESKDSNFINDNTHTMSNEKFPRCFFRFRQSM